MCKKIIIFFLFFTMLISPAIAQETDFCATKPYPIGNVFGRTFQTLIGVNYTASKIAESAIEKELQKNANGEFKAKVKSYSAFSLASGKFKKLDIEGKNVSFDDIYISYFKLSSRCNFMHIDLSSKEPKFLTPFFFDFEAKITSDDLNKLVATQQYKKYFLTMKYNNEKLNLVEFSNPTISLDGNKFNINVVIKTPFMRKIKCGLNSDLKIENNKFALDNMVFMAGNRRVDVSFLKTFLSLANPLLFIQSKIEGLDVQVALEQVSVINNEINTKGNIIVPQN